MGYETDYYLLVEGLDEGEASAQELLNRLSDIDGGSRFSVQELPSLGTWKWYEHEGHLRALSALPEYKACLFTLEGHGGSNDDHWRKYFRNGKVQVAIGEIVYPDFNPKKLK